VKLVKVFLLSPFGIKAMALPYQCYTLCILERLSVAHRWISALKYCLNYQRLFSHKNGKYDYNIHWNKNHIHIPS